MPYTRVWNITSPPGSAQASTADDEIRNLREDIEERMDDITAAGGLWSADDPILLDNTNVGAQTAVGLFFSHELIQHGNDEDDTLWTDPYFESDNTANRAAYLPLSPMLPVNCTLQTVSVLIATDASAVVDTNVYWRTYAAPSPTNNNAVADIQNHTNTAITDLLIGGPLAHAVATDRMYYIKWNNTIGSTRFRIYGVKITIDVADLTAYI